MVNRLPWLAFTIPVGVGVGVGMFPILCSSPSSISRSSYHRTHSQAPPILYCFELLLSSPPPLRSSLKKRRHLCVFQTSTLETRKARQSSCATCSSRSTRINFRSPDTQKKKYSLFHRILCGVRLKNGLLYLNTFTGIPLWDLNGGVSGDYGYLSEESG